jgi:hypothetical protein
MTIQSSRAHSREAMVLLFICVPLIAVGVACLFLQNLVTYESVITRMNELSADGKAPFSSQRYASIIARLQGVGAAFLCLAILAFLLRSAIARRFAAISHDAGAFFEYMRVWTKSTLNSDGRETVVALVVVWVAGIALRLHYLGQPIRYDEANSLIYYAAKPLYLALSYYGSTNNHVFFTLLMYVSSRVFGEAEWAIRFPAFLAGLLLIPFVFFVVRGLYDRATALIAAVFAAGAMPFVEYSCNARGYTVQLLIFVALLGLCRFLAKIPNSFGWALWAALTALGFYTIPTMLLLYGVVALWAALSVVVGDTAVTRAYFTRNFIMANLVAALLTLGLYIPVIATSELAAPIGHNFGDGFSVVGFLEKAPKWLYELWWHWNRNLPSWMAGALGLAALAGGIFHSRIARFKVPLYVAAVTWLVPVMLLLQHPLYLRVWIFLGLIYFIVASAGLSLSLGFLRSSHFSRTALVESFVAILMFCVLAGTELRFGYVNSAYGSNRVETLPDGPEIAEVLKKTVRAGDLLLRRFPSSTPMEYYLGRMKMPYKAAKLPVPSGKLVEFYVLGSAIAVSPAHDGRRVFIIESAYSDPLDQIAKENDLCKCDRCEIRIFRQFSAATVYVAEGF